ncbi:MAG: ATP-binding cassette domain-containing protein [Erysipelotrichales bacterium]|nr:ATP-binding cassette domain-containing protein [Erysipelotrichales bacterium]
MLLEINNLTFTYNNANSPVIKNLNYHANEGEIRIIAGSSGSGKSTLAYLMAGIYPGKFGSIDEGDIIYNNESIVGLLPYQRLTNVALMFQNSATSFCMRTLREELHFVLENLLLEEELIEKRIMEVIHSMHLASFIDMPLTEISEGQKQIAALASVLVIKPRVIILDEPFAHMDDVTADKMLVYIHKIRRKEKITFIVIDHLVERWLDVADDVSLLGKDGSFVVTGVTKGSYHVHEKHFYDQGVVVPYKHKPRVYHDRSASTIMRFENFVLLHKNKRDTLLDYIDYSIPKGSIIGIYGRSGVGKTTLLEAIAANSGYEGNIYVDSELWSNYKIKERIKKMSFVVQNTSDVFLRDRVLDEFVDAILLINPGMKIEECALKAIEELKKCHLEGYLRSNPYKLSIGQQRLLLLQIAFCSKHDIIIVDEPTYGQDYDTLTYIMKQIIALKEEGRTIIFTTHNMDVAREYSDIMLHYHDKRLEEVR